MFTVRCLGPGPEHRFKSASKYKRVCSKCEIKILSMMRSAILRRGVMRDPKDYQYSNQ